MGKKPTPKKKPKKDAVAAALARKRWAGVDAATRSAVMREVVRARYAKKGGSR